MDWIKNRLGRLPQWLRDVLALRDRDVPTDLYVSGIVPAVDILGVAQRLQSGTQTVAAGVVAQLPDIPGVSVLVQADPANVDNVLIGASSAAVSIVLQPGENLTANISNLNLLFFSSAGAGAVTVNFIVAQPV